MDGNDDVGGGVAADAGDATALGWAMTVDDLFPAAWMRVHTQWGDIDAMLTAGKCPASVGPEASPRARERLDRHVAATTEFDSWTAMLDRAVADLAE